MRRAVFDLSSGLDKHQITTTAVNQFLMIAKSPGLDVPDGTNTYTLVMDYISTIKNLCEYLSRLTLLTLHKMSPVPISPNVTWSFQSFQDESYNLHQWWFTDHITDNDVTRFMHSWTVFGDISASRLPLTLHIIAIGRRNGSHLVSPWTRAFRSPAMNHYRFQHKDGSALRGDWKPIYFSDNRDNDPETWVDLMLDDNAAKSLITHINVREPSDLHVENFRREIISESSFISDADQDPFNYPMSRPSCHVPYNCPHIGICYSSTPKENLSKSSDYESK